MSPKKRNFAAEMSIKHQETLRVRIISVGFSCLAFAVFKPLGMGALGPMLYVHLLAVWAMGVGVCYVTEGLMKYVVRMSATFDRGVDYIIRRNLRFQLINSPLEALMTCAYMHFPMARIDAPDPLSWQGCLQTVCLLAFCSFAIGMYWRYKFRSRYLAADLAETKALNEHLKLLQQKSPKPQKEETAEAAEGEATPSAATVEHAAGSGAVPSVEDGEATIVLRGTTNESVALHLADLLYVEAIGNYVKVYHLRDGAVRADMLRATSKQIEEDLRACPMVVRCHRAFLVNLSQVDHLVSNAGLMQLVMRHCPEAIPVSRSNVPHIKEAILGHT